MPRTRPGGFTLVELLVVMAIVALLLSLAVPRYFAHLDAAAETVTRQNLITLRTAIDQFHGDRGHYPASLDALVAARYLRAVPVDPLTENADWILVPAPDGEGIMDVKTAARGRAQDGTDYADW